MPGDRRREAEDRHIDEVKRKVGEAAHVEGAWDTSGIWRKDRSLAREMR